MVKGHHCSRRKRGGKTSSQKNEVVHPRLKRGERVLIFRGEKEFEGLDKIVLRIKKRELGSLKIISVGQKDGDELVRRPFEKKWSTKIPSKYLVIDN